MIGEDILVDSEALPWMPLGDGITYKVLRISEESGTWSSIMRMEAGSCFAPHKHLGAADFYVLRGALHYRAGTAKAGHYGYEPLGMVHGRTTCDEETIFLFNAYGPIAFFDEEGRVQNILDWEFVKNQLEGKSEASFSGGAS